MTARFKTVDTLSEVQPKGRAPLPALYSLSKSLSLNLARPLNRVHAVVQRPKL
jgi:hypothetical protein